jgi:hypothetical protein
VAFEEAELDRDYRKMEWTCRDIPAESTEPMGPDARDYLPWVDVSTITDWGTIAAWYGDLVAGQSSVTDRVRKEAESITAECEDEEASVRALYDFVANEITYEFVPFIQTALIPRQPDEVLVSRFGDCKDKCNLMLALLESVGIEGFRMVLTTPWDLGSNPFLPSPRFNHVILGRSSGDSWNAWYDPTVVGGVPGTLPGPLVGSQGLLVGHGEAELEVLGSARTGPETREARTVVVPDGSGTATVVRHVLYRSGDDVSSLRRAEMEYSTEELERYFLMALAEKYPGSSLDSFAWEGATTEDSVGVHLEFSVPGCFTSSGGLLVGPVPLPSRLAGDLGRGRSPGPEAPGDQPQGLGHHPDAGRAHPVGGSRGRCPGDGGLPLPSGLPTERFRYRGVPHSRDRRGDHSAGRIRRLQGRRGRGPAGHVAAAGHEGMRGDGPEDSLAVKAQDFSRF